MTEPDWGRTSQDADHGNAAGPDAAGDAGGSSGAERIRAEPPRVWAILEGRAGDDAQVVNLVESLGWPYQCKRPLYSLWEVLVHRVTGTAGAPGREAVFSPPWPDLLVTIGGRSVVAARRIKALSGGRTKLVCLGRPWAPLDWFDLVVTTPQYRLPPLPNVLQNALPLNRPPGVPDSQAMAVWRSRLAALPRPHVALLVGGANGTYRFDRRVALDLARKADARAREAGGSLLVATSPRTGAAAARALVGELTAPHLVYRWSAASRDDNPYALFLEDADEVVVTGDSASMLADACGTEVPVFLYQLPETRLTRVLNRYAAWRAAAREAAGTAVARRARMERWIAKGWWTPRRNMARIHEQLLARGRVARLGEPPTDHSHVSELNTTVNRVRRLVNFYDQA